MRKFLGEFKEFITRGNVMDMAVGIIMGTAFTAIVTSLVNEVVMPIIGVLIGGVNFTDFKIVLKPAVGEIAEVAIAYGSFIQHLINFILIALIVFLLIKTMNKFRRKKETEAKEETVPAPSDEILLLSEIRDLLKK